LSRKELAQKAGVSHMTIWNIESVRTLNPQQTTIESLESALGEPIPEDIGEELTQQADLKVEGLGPFTTLTRTMKTVSRMFLGCTFSTM